MINIGQYIETAINWLTNHFATFFDTLSTCGVPRGRAPRQGPGRSPVRSLASPTRTGYQGASLDKRL